MEADYTELKKRAAEYYSKNEVPEKLEEILNKMFFENPKDIYGRLSDYFDEFALKPVLSRLHCQSVLSSGGNPALKFSVYAIVKNHQKLMSTSFLSLTNEMSAVNQQAHPENMPPPTVKEIAEMNCSNTNEMLSVNLKGIPMLNQTEVDRALNDWISEAERNAFAKTHVYDNDDLAMRTPTPSSGKKKKTSAKGGKGKAPDKPIPPKEHMEPRLKGCSSIFAASQTILKGASSFLNCPPFEHLLHSFEQSLLEEVQSGPSLSVTMPAVAMTMVNGGKQAPGKQNLIKTVFAIAKPSWSTKESIEHLCKVYETVGKILVSKGGLAAPTGAFGAYQPTYDKPEQAVDVVVEAANQCGLAPGQDIFIGLDCAGHELFDYDKGKYEIATGSMKSADEIVDVYKDLMARYPAVNMLVDPIRKEDKEQWPKLCEIIGDRCFVIGGEHIYGSLHTVNISTLAMRKSSGVAIGNGGRWTLSDISRLVADVRATEGVSVIMTSPGDVCDDIYSDIAVGLGVDIVRFGAPSRGENITKINRLIEIEELIKADEKLSISYQTEFKFPDLKPPPPEVSSNDEHETSQGFNTPDTHKTKKK